jgi:hypothetical protein
LKNTGIKAIVAVSGETRDPTGFAWRFSPGSNNKRDKITPADEQRILIATDVLSEGQNLQDGAIVIYDLPWAIIRLIQRAGRVDCISQKAEQILCYSFFACERRRAPYSLAFARSPRLFDQSVHRARRAPQRRAGLSALSTGQRRACMGG